MQTVSLLARGFLRALTCATILSVVPSAEAEFLTNPILFVTQVPVWETKNTVTSVGGNHLATTVAAPRGGDLMIRYPVGALKNLTRSAGYGESGTLQGAASIAVRDPCIHWSGERAIFSMVVGTAANARWQMYEVTGLGPSDTPVITKVPNQPANYNNVQPCYTSADDVVFVCDRPREGAAHLFPARDEQGLGEINTGLWQLNPATERTDPLGAFPERILRPVCRQFWSRCVQPLGPSPTRSGGGRGRIRFRQ